MSGRGWMSGRGMWWGLEICGWGLGVGLGIRFGFGLGVWEWNWIGHGFIPGFWRLALVHWWNV